MIVKTWKNKSHGKRNATFGIRISKADVHVFSGLTQINLQINGSSPIKVDITKGFHKKCPEIRHRQIGIFFVINGLNSWKKDHPHPLTLTQVNATTFNLTYP